MKFRPSRFTDPRFEIRVRVNQPGKFDQGKMKFVRISEEFELSEFQLTGVNYYKMYYQIQGKLDLVRVSGVLLYYQGNTCLKEHHLKEVII